jgi:hypothetical protein
MENRIYWLASYPKSGNTWFRTFLKNMLKNDKEPVSINELNIEQSDGIGSSRDWIDEALGFDSADLYQWEIDRLRPTVYNWTVSQATECSYHKIHDACWQLDSGEWLVSQTATAGALYFVRNPLDVAISYANHCQSSIDKAIQRMGESEHCFAKNKHQKLSNQLEQRLLSWSEHVASWVDNPDIDTCVIRYEDMKHQAQATFTRAAAYLQLPTDPDRIAKAIRFSDFSVLQKQEKQDKFQERPPNTASFFRKGIAGDWQQTLTPAQIERVISDHHVMMQRFGYLDAAGNPQVM